MSKKLRISILFNEPVVSDADIRNLIAEDGQLMRDPDALLLKKAAAEKKAADKAAADKMAAEKKAAADKMAADKKAAAAEKAAADKAAAAPKK